MANLHNKNGREFFGAITKNSKALVGKTKKEVKDQIAKRGIAKHNVVLFRCWLPSGDHNIRQKMLVKPGFKLKRDHYRVLREACFDFLENSD